MEGALEEPPPAPLEEAHDWKWMGKKWVCGKCCRATFPQKGKANSSVCGGAPKWKYALLADQMGHSLIEFPAHGVPIWACSQCGGGANNMPSCLQCLVGGTRREAAPGNGVS